MPRVVNPPGTQRFVPSEHGRRELYSLERMSLGWGWNNAKNAAALACELLRWATPPQRWIVVEPGEDGAYRGVGEELEELTVLERRLGVEQPVGGDPYREAGPQRVCVDPPEVTDARFEIANIVSYVMMFVEDRPITAPCDFGEPDDHPLKKLYWYAAHVGQRAESACNIAGNTLYRASVETTQANGSKKIDIPNGIHELKSRWYRIGAAAKAATEFLRKFATNNPVIGEVHGAAGGILNQISSQLAYAGKPTEEITGRMFHWRVKDALKGKELSPELDANLRPAFEAAWAAAEYDFAYSLLEDLDTLVEQP